jgi:hypothetical protein
MSHQCPAPMLQNIRGPKPQKNHTYLLHCEPKPQRDHHHPLLKPPPPSLLLILPCDPRLQRPLLESLRVRLFLCRGIVEFTQSSGLNSLIRRPIPLVYSTGDFLLLSILPPNRDLQRSTEEPRSSRKIPHTTAVVASSMLNIQQRSDLTPPSVLLSAPTIASSPPQSVSCLVMTDSNSHDLHVTHIHDASRSSASPHRIVTLLMLFALK